MSDRLIHTAAGTYKYRHGKGGTVIITPHGKRIHAWHHELKQCTPMELERKVWKQGGYQVRPSHVRDYIIREIELKEAE